MTSTHRNALVLAALLGCVARVQGQTTDPAAESLRLRVTAIEPAPNYKHSSLEQAQQRLVDGIEERFPMWTRTGGVRRIELSAQVASIDVLPRHRMDAVAWSTLSPPIWTEFEWARRTLAAGGGTVFMIPPWFNPAVYEPARSRSGRRRFQEQISILSQSGLVLVHLDVITRLGGCRGRRSAVIGERMRDLAALVQESGVPFSNWAVYPTDEAHDEELGELLQCAKAIKAADSRIQIYANPTPSRKPELAQRYLNELQPYIDIWQPRAALARGQFRAFFRNQKRFWIYDNPREPAKSDSPRFYRALAWRAWQLGATGTGFWAFDDTRKSSAWDDLDGTRPDWAVVYESSHGLIESRRWRAFTKGLDDAAALASLVEGSGETRERMIAVLASPSCHIRPRFPARTCRDALVRALLADG